MDGDSIPIEHEESNFKDRYLDEYNGKMLPKHLIREAVEDEFNYLHGKVWKLITVSEMENVQDYISVLSRWLMCNKGDADTPDCRARLASGELNCDGKVDAFSASTPTGSEEMSVRQIRFDQSKGPRAIAIVIR